MLTVVVVHKHGDRMPGSGFFQLACTLGHGTADREAFKARGTGEGAVEWTRLLWVWFARGRIWVGRTARCRSILFSWSWMRLFKLRVVQLVGGTTAEIVGRCGLWDWFRRTLRTGCPVRLEFDKFAGSVAKVS